MEKLEQEKFNTVKELAELQTNISLGRANLINIQETTEKYMELREKEAEQRVLKVLKESRNALEETTNNHKELLSYNNELQAYANELKSFARDITTLFEDFNKRMDVAQEKLDNNYKDVQDTLGEIRKERKGVADDRERLSVEVEDMKQAKRRLVDREQTLARDFKRLNKK